MRDLGVIGASRGPAPFVMPHHPLIGLSPSQGLRFPLASPRVGPTGCLALALGTPQLSRRLRCPRAIASSSAFPYGIPTPGGRGPAQGCRMEAGAWPLRCLVLRRGHTDLSSGKTLLRFGFNPW